MNDPALTLDGDIPQKPKSSRRALILETLQTVVLAGLFYLVISLATARVVVDGPSMRPTLISGEWIVVNRLTYKLGSPQRGDVIVFLPPTNAQTDDLIKRVIGLPGETVEIRDGSVWINGKVLEESYATGTTAPDNRWQLGAGQLFVMGDNRQLSLDSRSFGPIPLREVVGRAWIIYWPPSEWGPLEWRNQTRTAAARLTENAFRYNIIPALCRKGIFLPPGWGIACRSNV
ncbi:MAG: signal peptidase I [Anaerolineales bacterium]|jgi:signal peptidase I